MSAGDPNVACDFEAELPLLLYQGELEREERERLRSHLATCARCSDAFAQLEATAIALDGAMAVPKPSAEQWKSLKENVLARVAAPAPAGDAPSPDEACESIEEDLLVLNEVGTERKKAVLAHIEKCASCRETRSAFGSIGLVLNRQPLAWPSIERWDSLKENVLSTIDSELKRSKEPARPERARVRFSLPVFARIAAGVALVASLGGGYALLRGPTPDDVRRQWHEAQGAGELAVVTRGYESVVQKGISMPECRYEVDDALTQLQAIRKFQLAYEQPNPELKRIQLLDIMVRYPSTRVTELALTEYNKIVAKPGAPARIPLPSVAKNTGFREDLGDLKFIDTTAVHRYNVETLEQQYKSLAEIGDDNERAKQEAELKGVLATVYFREAQSEHNDRNNALSKYKKALEYAEPNTPVAFEAAHQISALGGR